MEQALESGRKGMATLVVEEERSVTIGGRAKRSVSVSVFIRATCIWRILKITCYMHVHP